MDYNTLEEIIINGTSYCPALSKYILNNNNNNCIICSKKDNISYYEIWYQNINLIICDECRISYNFNIKCDNCKEQIIFESLHYKNNDICLKCANNFIDKYHKNIKPTIIIDENCYLTLPCKHKININGIENIMSSLEIIKILKENNLEIPEHFKKDV